MPHPPSTPGLRARRFQPTSGSRRGERRRPFVARVDGTADALPGPMRTSGWVFACLLLFPGELARAEGASGDLGRRACEGERAQGEDGQLARLLERRAKQRRASATHGESPGEAVEQPQPPDGAGSPVSAVPLSGSVGVAPASTPVSAGGTALASSDASSLGAASSPGGAPPSSLGAAPPSSPASALGPPSAPGSGGQSDRS